MLLQYTALFFALLFFLWIAKEILPSLLTLVSLRSLKFSFLGRREEQQVIAASTRTQEKIEMLQGLGFSLLGVKVEKLPLWGKQYLEISLVSASAETYASMMLDPYNNPAEVYFYTPLKGYGLIFTRAYNAGVEVEWADTSVKNIPSRNLQEAYKSHQERLRLFKDKGLLPEAGSSQQTRLEATRMFYASKYSRLQSRRLILSQLVALVFSILVLVLALTWNLRSR